MISGDGGDDGRFVGGVFKVLIYKTKLASGGTLPGC